MRPPDASVKRANWKVYRQQVSILCPRGYEPRALPLRHVGWDCSSALMHHCDVMLYTGNPSRSGDLGVMSPARFLCAMPVNERGRRAPPHPPLRRGV